MWGTLDTILVKLLLSFILKYMDKRIFFKNANYIPLLKDFYLISNQNRASHNLIVQNMNKPK